MRHGASMKRRVTFRQYSSSDREICLSLFDANCPIFFAPNERADYLTFLEKGPSGYELCLLDDQIAGAFGLIGSDASRRRLNWIMLNPAFQGLGVGREIMERVSALATWEGLQLIEIAASHMSAPFFARFGAVITKATENGWGPGMHRVDMELSLVPNNMLERTCEK